MHRNNTNIGLAFLFFFFFLSHSLFYDWQASHYCFPHHDEIVRLFGKRDSLLEIFYLRLTLASATSLDEMGKKEENVSRVGPVLSRNRKERCKLK